MNRLTSVIIVTALLAAGLSPGAAAQENVPSGSSLFETLPVILPWTGTSNPAALADYNLGNHSLARAGYTWQNDEISFIQQPELISTFNVAIKGYKQLEKITLYGSFGYSNSGYEGINYNGTMMFNTLNPYILGDTVSARQSMEGFDMEGKLSYRMNDRLSLAVGAEYYSAVGAKQKDPRNKNTISLLKVTPGVTYEFGSTKVGLSGSIYNTSDELSYRVEGNWNQSLFTFLGLGYYRQEANISSYSQWYTGQGYAGALQASHDAGDIYIIAELSYDHFTEQARTGSSLRLINGIATTNDISLSASLKISGGMAQHLFSLAGSYKAVSGDEILQRSYKINKGTYSYDSLATVSWIENKHMINDIAGVLSYSYMIFDSNSNIDLELGGAVDVKYFSTEHYPVQSYGYYNTLNIGGKLFARKLFRFGALLVTPGLDAGYRMNLGSDISYMVQPLSVPEMVYHDYYISKADVISAAVSVRLERPFTGRKFINSLFLVPRGRWAAAPGSEAGKLSGYMLNVVAGITF
jgi:hypothetical protein